MWFGLVTLGVLYAQSVLSRPLNQTAKIEWNFRRRKITETKLISLNNNTPFYHHQIL